MVLPLYASMEKLDFRLVEAGCDLYANRLQVLWHVIIPLLKPGIVAGSILVFIPLLGAYVTPRVLGGGKNTMLGNLIEQQFVPGRNWPLGAAISVTLMLIGMIALLIYVRQVGRSPGWQVARLAGRQVGRLAGWQVGRSAGRHVGRSAGEAGEAWLKRSAFAPCRASPQSP
jgi:ABC-type Fe3+ transport system permease subunit